MLPLFSSIVTALKVSLTNPPSLPGICQHWATAEGQRLRSENQNDRPFVLSRAFFAGTQRCACFSIGR
jgi:hypothetical protein